MRSAIQTSSTQKGNKDPVQVERVDVFSLPTIQRVEVLSRGNQYSALPVEARDQSQIEIFGPRVGPTVQAHEICDEFVMGPAIAQTILQSARSMFEPSSRSSCPGNIALLDPMDIVTITDANLGLSNYPVRIIEIEEDDKGLLAFTCGGAGDRRLESGVQSGRRINWSFNQTLVSLRSRSIRRLIVEPPLSLTRQRLANLGRRLGYWSGIQWPMGRRGRLALGRWSHVYSGGVAQRAASSGLPDVESSRGGGVGRGRYSGC